MSITSAIVAVTALGVSLAAAALMWTPGVAGKNQGYDALLVLGNQTKLDKRRAEVEKLRETAKAAGAAVVNKDGKETKDSKDMKEASPVITTTTAIPRIISRAGYDITPFTEAQVSELAAGLSPEDRRIVLAKGTEAAFCGTLLDNKKKGVYVSKLGGLPLFASSDKFNSGTGWPSFFKPVSWDHIRYVRDGAHGMERIEILDTKSGAHLGHVFEDGPAPTGLRYCLNSASLEFIEEGQTLPLQPIKTETAYFAGGCFWGVEDRFQEEPGVISAISGYQGGKLVNPTYKQVCTDTTGHAETVKIMFDPTQTSYEKLLEAFFKFHNPTHLDRQGPDVGTQYRSAIFADANQLPIAKAFLEKNAAWRGSKIVTKLETLESAGKFYEAEEYHQDYHQKNGGSCAVP